MVSKVEGQTSKEAGKNTVDEQPKSIVVTDRNETLIKHDSPHQKPHLTSQVNTNKLQGNASVATDNMSPLMKQGMSPTFEDA